MPKIEYTKKVSAKARSIRIHIERGQVVVVTPKYIPNFFIDRFVEQSREWIEEQLLKYKIIIQPKIEKQQKFEEITYLGQSYPVRFGTVTQISFEERVFYVCPVDHTEDSLQKAIDRWRHAQAELFLTKRAHVLAQTMNVTFSALSFRIQQTRWGSCSTRKHINLNKKLIGAPPEIVDYVIIHELAHLTHMDHSTEFWREVERFDPAYKAHRSWLKRQGMLLL